MLIALRLATGVGEALVFVGSGTIVADIAPVDRRGEALSIYTIGVWGGLAIGPIVGRGDSRRRPLRPRVARGGGMCRDRGAGGPRASRDPSRDRRSSRRGKLIHPAAHPHRASSSSPPSSGSRASTRSSRSTHASSGSTASVRSSSSTRRHHRRDPDRRTAAARSARAEAGVGSRARPARRRASLIDRPLEHASRASTSGRSCSPSGQALAFPSLMTLAVDGAPPASGAPSSGTFTAFADVGFARRRGQPRRRGVRRRLRRRLRRGRCRIAGRSPRARPHATVGRVPHGESVVGSTRWRRESSGEVGSRSRGSSSAAGTSAASARRRRSSGRGSRATRRSGSWTPPGSSGSRTFDTADAYGGGRSETWIGEWLATKGAAVRDAITIETKTFNPMEARARTTACRGHRIRRQIETSLERLGRRAGRAVHGARARREHAARGDAARVRRARARRQGRRRRRVQLHRRAARRGGRDLGARGPHALRVGAELVLAPRPGRRRDRLPGLPRARPRLRGVRPARRRLARRQLPARRAPIRRDRG